MDKKILLGGAAALLLVGNMYATPANAAIEMGISGEASVKMSMGDVCSNTNAAASSLNAALGFASGTASSATAYTDVATVTLESAVTGVNDAAIASDVDDKTDFEVTYDVNGCGTANEDNPVLSTGSKFEISASGTLANGLTIDYSNTAALDDYSLSFGGAFGGLTIKPGVSAIDESIVGDTAGADVTGPDMGGHKTKTDGSAGNAVLYTAPGLGNLDFHISYAPNSANSGLDSAEYTDTFGVAAVFNSDMITLSAGFENATSDETCNDGAKGAITILGGSDTYTPIAVQTAATIVADDDDVTTDSDQAAASIVAENKADAEVIHSITAASAFDDIYGGTLCGDQSLVAIGASMDAGDITISAAYSNLDTDEADRTTTSVGIGTSFGDYSLAAGWANTKHSYARGGLQDEQTVIDVSLGTSLGDGVDLDLNFSQNDMSKASQANGGGDTNNYYAAMEVTVGF